MRLTGFKLTGAWLTDPRTVRVFDALEEAGHRAWFVGGAVRDAALGRPVRDIDIATDARPEAVVAAVEAAGLRAVPTGIEHGTVTVVSGGLGHEVTTLRRDVATDGRRAVVAYTDRLEDDAARRDFTINALYADREGRVIDPVGGLADLDPVRICFVGEAEARIREDYLRILRFFRFHAHYAAPDAGFDADALAAIAGNCAGTETLSAERLGHEMLRLLAAPDPAPALGAMAGAGVLHRILPGADPLAVARLVAIESGTAPDPIVRLAALGGEGAPDRLRLSRAEAKRLATLRQGVESGAGLGEIAWREGRETALATALLRAAATGAPRPPGIEAEIALGAGAVFPVRPADLMPDLAGAALGARLADLEAKWVASGFTLTREELLVPPEG